MRLALFLVLLSVLVTLLVVSHVYLYRRLLRDPQVPNQVAKLGRSLLWFMGVGTLIGTPAVRYFDVPGKPYVGFIWLIWAGLVALCVSILVVGDVIRAIYSRVLAGDTFDSGRRRFFARGLAGAATATAVTTATSGVALALSDPTLESVQVPIDGLPDALDGFRIVQLSDTHFGPTLRHEFADHLVERVNALRPDLVALTGDLVDGSVSDLGPIVQKLASIESRHGIFFVTGNHEYYSGAGPWVEALDSWGIRVLRNECAVVEHDGAELDILGVDDWRASRFMKDHGYDFKRANQGRDRKRPSVLLSHQPKAIHDAAEGEIDLVLSGHTHGGQIWPGKYIVKLVQPYVRGLHRHSERTWIYVHCGAGFWGPPIRVGVSADVALIELKRA